MNHLSSEDVGVFPPELLTPEFSAALVRENFIDLVIKERLTRAQEDDKLKHFFHMAQGARVSPVLPSLCFELMVIRRRHDRLRSTHLKKQ